MFRWIRSDEQVIQTRYLEMIERELAYYRAKYDEERNSKDRTVDQLLETKGVPLPISDLGTNRHDTLQIAFEESQKLMQTQMAEIYGSGGDDVAYEPTAETSEESSK